MPLFRGHVLRSIAIAGLLVLGGNQLLKSVPQNLFVFTMAQTSVAIISISSLMLIVISHHRRQGEVFTQAQEETLLVGAFALFWLALLVSVKAYKHRGSAGLPFPAFSGREGSQQQSPLRHTPTARAPAYRVTETIHNSNPGRMWPCSQDAVHCVVEEWRYD